MSRGFDSGAAAPAENDIVLRVDSLSKSYPGVRAVQDVSFACRRGEVHALLGENGAGKSTLIKILSGAVERDTGSITLDGQPIAPASPIEAQRAGISTIFQELNIITSLSSVENIFLGREHVWFGTVDRRRMRREAQGLLGSIGAHIDLDTPVKRLSIAEQQLLEIAKALAVSAKIVIMDEPTAALSEAEVVLLFAVIRKLSASGVTVIYVSHRLEEIFQICDRATVLKDGRFIKTVNVDEVDRVGLVRLMVGRDFDAFFGAAAPAAQNTVLDVSGLQAPGVSDVSFSINAGEVVGLAGLVGAGRTELAMALFGAAPRQHARFCLNGREISPNSPRDAIAAGIAFLPEDRKHQGLVLDLPMRFNMSLVVLGRLLRFGLLRLAEERRVVSNLARRLAISAPDLEVPVRRLSGGNQQKVVLAKWLASAFDLIILDEPTRGVDVGAKVEIYTLIHEIAKAGKAVLLISSELPEVIGVSHRILAMKNGRLVAEFGAGPTEEMVMEAIAG
jgi:ABC-type sugar transport system ATPase subunit